jgi:GT2 family glycosyltransferase
MMRLASLTQRCNGNSAMDYSIIIPVFNKADLTKRCLETLPESIAGAGSGEVIVVDNASTDHTAGVLAEFPWIRLIRNEKNLGFAAANNQAARVANGEFLVLLNNDTEPWKGWLSTMLAHAREPNVGAVGARLLYPDRTCQHGGVVVAGNPFGMPEGTPYHHNFQVPFTDADVKRVQDMQIVTGACLLTPRDLYEKLRGLDEAYWNGYEDVDYCLKVRREGRRVVYAGDAVLYHFESQSGIQRFRRAAWNTELLQRRWSGSLYYDGVEKNIPRGLLRHPYRTSRTLTTPLVMPIPPVTVVVHSMEPACGRDQFEAQIRRTEVPLHEVVWAIGEGALATAREAMRIRGVRHLAFVRGDSQLEPRWLDELFRQVASTPSAVAATYSPDLPIGENVGTLGADGRCVLLALHAIPAHVELEPFDTMDASVGDLLVRLLPEGFGTRGAGRKIATLGPISNDPSFERVHGRTLASLSDPDPKSLEPYLAPKPQKRGLVSIVTLSWNAPQFTKLALASIAQHTSEPYEVIVVDNGSGEETLEMLRQIDDPHVRVVYNKTNRGFGGGNNDGIANANGEFVVVLNNDVIVTDGWLDALLEPFGRIPNLGATAPRSNKIVGDQEVVDAVYNTLDEMAAYAARRRERFGGRGFLTDRAIGFCLCMSRTVIDQIGGFDERFAVGNFEDDDICMRVRAAGYQIYVCDDCFIHHFGSQSFIANKVDYMATMQSNWSKFADKWGYLPAYPTSGYDPRRGIVGGFDRTRHYAPLPSATVPVNVEEVTSVTALPSNDFVFVAAVHDEESWTRTAEFVRRFLQAFDAESPVTLMIGTNGEPQADKIGTRVLRLLEKLRIPEERSADIAISDENDLDAWRDGISARVMLDVRAIEDRSPSGLRRLLEGVKA